MFTKALLSALVVASHATALEPIVIKVSLTLTLATPLSFALPWREPH